MVTFAEKIKFAFLIEEAKELINALEECENAFLCEVEDWYIADINIFDLPAKKNYHFRLRYSFDVIVLNESFTLDFEVETNDEDMILALKAFWNDSQSYWDSEDKGTPEDTLKRFCPTFEIYDDRIHYKETPVMGKLNEYAQQITEKLCGE